MSKFIDNVCFALAILILTFILSTTLTKNLAFSIILSIIITSLLIICIEKTIGKKKSKHINQRDFDTYAIVKGIDYQLDILTSIYPMAIREDKYIIKDDFIIMPYFKLGQISRDDVLKIYNTAKDKKINKVYIITNSLDRTSIAFSKVLYDVDFNFVKSSELYKLLKEKSLLPIYPAKIKKTKIPLGDYFTLIFAKDNAKRYIFTSFILLFVGILTPIKTYYYILSGISSIMCLLSLFSKNSNKISKKLPK